MRSSRPLFLSGLLLVLIPAGLEIKAFFAAAQNWDKLLSLSGLLTITGWIALLLAGLSALVAGLISPSLLGGLSNRISFPAWLRWAVISGLLLSPVWFYLYSPWQDVFPAPWTHFLFALGLSQLITFFTASSREFSFGVREASLSFLLFLYTSIVVETRFASSSPTVYRAVTFIGLLIVFAFAFIVLTERRYKVRDGLLKWKARLRPARILLGAVFLLTPLILRYLAGASFYILNPNIRFGLLLVSLCVAACLLESRTDRLASTQSFVVGIGFMTLTSFLTSSLMMVVNLPFSLTWSEGNRFYDYSLMFGQKLYDYAGTIASNYDLPGRYILWGVLFLWPNLPIWVHRLWNVFLLVLPGMGIAIALARQVKNGWLKIILFLWISIFFVVEAPVQPPILLTAFFVLWFGFDRSISRRIVVGVIASAYAASSRFTWIVIPAILLALIDLLLYYPERKGNFVQKALPILAFTLPGLFTGLLLISSVIEKVASSQSVISNQPLLWYRLLPNPTYPVGVLFGSLLTAGPVVALLIWMIVSKRWKLDWLQLVGVWGALGALFAIGLVVSSKIGGGGDLHNLDMYLVSLVTVAGISAMQNRLDEIASWGFLPRAMLVVVLFLPVYQFTPFVPGAASHPYLSVPDEKDARVVLSEIQKQVADASGRGEVLFMDQRQLLTFGYIRNVPFVPEYEKKYMMDQAMGSNLPYFELYYRDLANKRFDLIVTEILTTNYQTSANFSEENNSWVKWVSKATLCFYEPLAIYKDENIELLVPKESPVGCEIYLNR